MEAIDSPNTTPDAQQAGAKTIDVAATAGTLKKHPSRNPVRLTAASAQPPIAMDTCIENPPFGERSE